MDLSRDIRAAYARFVAQVTSLGRELARAQAAEARAAGRGRVGRVGRVGRSSTAPATARARRGGATGRRSAAEIEQLRVRLLAHIEAHPGQRIEQVKLALATTTAQLAVPLQKLIYADLVRAVGERRATRYVPATTAAIRDGDGGGDGGG